VSSPHLIQVQQAAIQRPGISDWPSTPHYTGEDILSQLPRKEAALNHLPMYPQLLQP